MRVQVYKHTYHPKLRLLKTFSVMHCLACFTLHCLLTVFLRYGLYLKFVVQLSVTLTLTTSTTDTVSKVLDAIADLLKIAVPPVFEIQSKCGNESIYHLAVFSVDLSACVSCYTD